MCVCVCVLLLRESVLPWGQWGEQGRGQAQQAFFLGLFFRFVFTMVASGRAGAGAGAAGLRDLDAFSDDW